MKRWSVVAILCVAAVLSVPGCIFDPDKEPGDGDDLLTTPNGVVVQLADAYRNKDIDRYLECLVDTFEYHLMPRDWNEVWPTPSWGKVQEETVNRHIFERMHHLEMTLVGDYAAKIADNPETWRLYREMDLLVWETADELWVGENVSGVGYNWLEFIIQKQSDGRFMATDCYELEQEP